MMEGVDNLSICVSSKIYDSHPTPVHEGVVGSVDDEFQRLVGVTETDSQRTGRRVVTPRRFASALAGISSVIIRPSGISL